MGYEDQCKANEDIAHDHKELVKLRAEKKVFKESLQDCIFSLEGYAIAKNDRRLKSEVKELKECLERLK